MKFVSTDLQGMPKSRAERSQYDTAYRPYPRGPRIGKPTSQSTGKNTGLGVFQSIYS